jgi:hypothetical protein
MQLNQRRYRDARRAEIHSGAGDGIEHPCRHHDDYAGRYLDMNHLAVGALLSILTSNATPIECVPAIMDLNVLPDMGRMTARLRAGARQAPSPYLLSTEFIRCPRSCGKQTHQPTKPSKSQPEFVRRKIIRL